MEEFPDEILHSIFSFLPLKERLRQERVCVRWAATMPYEKTRHLDLVQALYGGRENCIDTLPISNALQSLLLRCGNSVERISFGKLYLLVTPSALNLITQYCPNLRELDLSYCTVTESLIPALFPLCETLEVLEFGNTIFSIRDSCIHADNMFYLFSNLREIRKLNLQKTSVQNFSSMPFLSPTLTSINLNQCGPLRGSVLLDFLVNAGYNLKELRLSAYSALDDTILDAICSISSLKILELSHLAFSDLLSHENLSELDFSGLAALTRLEGLYLQYNNAINDAILRAVCRACAQLRVLNLAYNRRITDFTPLASLAHLNTLIVAATERFTNRDLIALSQNGHLRVFQATNCPRLGAPGLEALIRSPSGPVLTELSFTGQWEAESVSDELFVDLVRICRKLETLSLHGCANLTDKCLERAAAGFFPLSLSSLDLSFCSELTDRGLDAVSEAAKRRKTPDLTFYVHQTKVTRVGLERKAPAIKIIL